MGLPGEGGGRPPAAPAFAELPLGAVRPAGWLLEQLQLQASGLTGRLEDLWPDAGPGSAWLGGKGEDWERGPYYLDGLVPLAHLLRDGSLLSRVERWVEALLRSQDSDGQFGPRSNVDWWPRMVALKALAQHFEATDDRRLLAFAERYLRHQLAELPQRPLEGWGQARAAESLLVVGWLYERTGEGFLLRLAQLILDQALDWGPFLATSLPCEKVSVFSHLTHVVNVAMGLKEPAVRYLFDGGREHLEQVLQGLANLDRCHGQAPGTFSGDEWLAGLDPGQGVELCAVVELMFSLEQLGRIFGQGLFGDRLEQVAYNALPAAVTADWRAHQYHQQPNQVLCSLAPRGWTFSGEQANVFGLEPHFGCCTANMHQGWPKLTRSLWMATPEGGLAVLAYAPCAVEAPVGGTGSACLQVETHYPFRPEVGITFRLPSPARFPLLLRLPGWGGPPHLRLNGRPLSCPPAEGGYARLGRLWEDGDLLELSLPMDLRVLPRPGGAVALAAGPLVFALPVGEDWRRIPGSGGFGDWEVHPTTPWNYGLELPSGSQAGGWSLEWGEVRSPPFAGEQTAVRLSGRGRRVTSWVMQGHSAAPPPPSPVKTTAPSQPLRLVPYGCARLRVAEFPWVPSAPS